MNQGDTFTEHFSVTPAVVDQFVNLFGDRNPLHTDAEFAKAHGFSDCVVHGNIMGGFLSYFVGECLPLKNVIIQKQEMQFYRPVFANDVLKLHANISDYFESVRTYEIKFKFENQRCEKMCSGKLMIGLI